MGPNCVLFWQIVIRGKRRREVGLYINSDTLSACVWKLRMLSLQMGRRELILLSNKLEIDSNYGGIRGVLQILVREA